MYINFWYPIVLGKDLPADKPVRATVFGLPFVAFRDAEGKASVIADTCVHRGGALSKGWVKDGNVVCPYHGWAYGGDGRCTKVPSLGDQKIPARAKVDAYPTEEKYGVVFAFLGDLPESERPPLWDIKEWGPDWKCQTYLLDLNAYYERSIENGLDPIHNEFVHPLQGAPKMDIELQRSPLPMEDMPYGSGFYMSFASKKEGTELSGDRQGSRKGAAGSWYLGPNTLVTYIDLTSTNSFHQYIFECPVDDSHTKLFFLNMRNWLMEDKHDARVEDLTLRVVHEDMAILTELNPVRTPENNTKEILVPGDSAVVRYRQSLTEWEEKGWRIDQKALKAKQGDVAFAVPCPARRESGNWVLDPVPLVPAKAAASASVTEIKRA